MNRIVKLKDLAKTIRSKNASIYHITLDIIFDDFQTYDKVRKTGVITRELIACLYGLPLEQITHFVEYDEGNAIKVTFKRPIPTGHPGESDVLACQQHIPLLDIDIPWVDG